MREEISLKDVLKWARKNPEKSSYIVLGVLVFLGAFVRAADLPHLFDQLLGLDPYVFYRYSTYIVERGFLPQNDTMRYWPFGFDVLKEGILHSYVNAYLYLLLRPFGVTLMQVFQIYPVLFASLSFIVFYFLVYEIFEDRKVALLSVAFLEFVPAFLFRTAAGFADKESIAIFLIFTTLLFFIKSLKERERKKSYLYALISGLALGLGGLSWGGIIFAFESIAAFMLLEVFFNKVGKREVYIYLIWFLTWAPFFALVSHRYGGLNFYRNSMIVPVIYSLLVSGMHVFLWPKVKKFVPVKMPEGAKSLLFQTLLLTFLAYLSDPSLVQKTIDWAINNLTHPIGLSYSRVAQSVAENQPPFFYGGSISWWSNFGFLLLLAFTGIFLLSLEMFPKRDVKLALLLFLFTTSLALSRFSPGSSWNNVFDYVQKISLVLFLLYFLYNYQRWGEEELKEVDSVKLFLFVYLLLTIIAGRGAVRNLFSAAPPLAIVSGFFVVKGYEEIFKATKDRIYPSMLYLIAIILIVHMAVTSYERASKSFWTSIVDGWLPAFQWIRENTEPDAVFLHWWDYGYWVQTLGNRTTVLDGGNYESPYKIARHFFTSDNMSEIRDILEYYGRPNYLLIIDDDIPKFYQIQRIAERDVWFTPFYFSQRMKNNLDKEYERLMLSRPTTGATPTFTDLSVNGMLWSKDETYVVAVGVPEENNTPFFNESYVFLYNTRFGTQVMKINCLCIREKGCGMIRENGFPSCIVPINQGLILIPYQNVNMLFTRLYVLNETVPGFEIVYDNGIPLSIQGITSQGITHVQIWRINYDELGG